MVLLKTIKFIATHPLNRGDALGAVARFVKWQIASRLVPGPVIVDWVNGARFVVRSGDKGLTGNLYTGLHEFRDMAFLLHFLRADDLFVDVGSNVGSYTILACAAVGARGIAFEPVPGTFGRLVENVRVNGMADRVVCVNKGVGDRSGTISFTSDGDTTNHALSDGEQSGSRIEVEITTLDAALAGAVPSLMKIDVEGYETPALEGALRTLGDPGLSVVIMELNGSGSRYGFDESRILRSMIDHGFRTFSYDPFARKLSSLDGKNLGEGNTLFVRNLPLVEERLRTAQSLTIHGKRL